MVLRRGRYTLMVNGTVMPSSLCESISISTRIRGCLILLTPYRHFSLSIAHATRFLQNFFSGVSINRSPSRGCLIMMKDARFGIARCPW